MYVLCYLLYICLVTCRLNTFFFLFKFENKLRKEVRLKNIQGILFKILFKLQKAHNAEKHAIFVFGEPNPRFFFFFFYRNLLRDHGVHAELFCFTYWHLSTLRYSNEWP